MNKKILLILVTIVLACSLVIVTGCEKKENKGNDEPATIEPNTNKDVVGDKEVDIFTFKNTSLVWNGNSTDLATLVTNTSDVDTYLKGFKVSVFDNEDNIIAMMEGYVGTTIKAHETTTLSMGHYNNLTNAARIEYEIIR